MRRRSLVCAAALGALACLAVHAADAPAPTPAPETKEQRDARMGWWREAKFGMFIHWGVYAVPAGEWPGKPIMGGGGEWIMNRDKISVADYKMLPAKFNPTKFNADEWVAVAKAAGMKYIVITAKHHDGFAMFKSKANPFNIVDATPYKHDPLADLAAACSKAGIKLGFYYSQDQDWTAPGGAAFGGHWDKAQDGDFAAYLHDKAIPQLKELLTNYQPSPAVIWFDTPTKDMTPELAGEIRALLKEHPGLIWNNRLGGGDPGDTETPEQHIPPNGYPGRDWETCMTINNTWGYIRTDDHFKSSESLIRNLIDIASKGGNYLLNVGPTAEGLIPQPEIDRLKDMGAWLTVNRKAIYGTHAGPFKKALAWGRVTQKGNRLYLSVFDWPKDGKLLLPVKNEVTKAALLADPKTVLATNATPDGVEIALPATAPDPVASVITVDLAGPADPLPPPPLEPQADGSIDLRASDADLLTHGSDPVKAQLEGGDDKPNIGYWVQPDDYAQWQVRINQPNDYAVSMTYAADPSSEGDGLVLMAGGHALKAPVEPTGSWKAYKTVTVGNLHFTEAGVVTFTLQSDGAKSSFINLRDLTLKPATH